MKTLIKTLILATLLIPICGIAETKKPNIVFIISDDQVRDTWYSMPFTHKNIVEAGTEFTKTYITTPLCCPSRASIVTGLYNCHNGVKHNYNVLSVAPVLFEELRKDDYYIGAVGKLLNSYRTEKERWYPYFDYMKIHELAKGFRHPDFNGEYVDKWNDIYGKYKEHINEFFDNRDTSKPYMFWFSPIIPHGPAIPEDQDLNYYGSQEPGIGEWEALRRRGLETQRGLDRIVKLIFTKIDPENDIIVYISDNGYLFDEHGLHGKNVHWDQVVNVPMAIRYDKVLGKGVSSKLVSNIDLTPTIFKWMGKDINQFMFDGIDIVNDSRKYLRLQGWKGMGWRSEISWKAVQTKHRVLAKVIRKRKFVFEEYDLRKDPKQENPLKPSKRLMRYFRHEFKNNSGDE